jgi:F-type H+-transporting ATPase subunit a
MPFHQLWPTYLSQSPASASPELPNFVALLSRWVPDPTLAAWIHQCENLIFSVLIASALALIFRLGLRRREEIPSTFQNLLELGAEKLQEAVVTTLGPSGKQHVPFLGTIFIYVLAMNIAGLFPLLKSPTSSINITLGLALCVFAKVQYLNIRNMGVLGFLYHLAGSPKGVLGWVLVPLMFPLELLTQFTRPATLAFRLCGNLLGEDILIGSFALFGVNLIANYYYAPPVGLPLQLPFMFLVLLTSVLQALVFTLLSTIYILLSMPHTEEHH